MNGILFALVASCVFCTSPPVAAGDLAVYWRDSGRGWHFYEETPAPAREVRPPPPVPSTAPARPAAILQLEQLRQAVENTRAIAILQPTEHHVRAYMQLEAQVVRQASLFADVAQRLAWTDPELDTQGRPVNAQALEVFERDQLTTRNTRLQDLARDHVLLFFFRGDCPYCHAQAPTLLALSRQSGLRIEAVSLDGGGLPGFARPRLDNGIARTLRVQSVPALYLAQPSRGEIRPIGFGVLSASQLLERLTAPPLPQLSAARDIETPSGVSP